MFNSLTGQLYGLEKFWAFLKYTRKKNLGVDPELKETLENYKTLEDFRVLVSDLSTLTLTPLELTHYVHVDIITA